VTTARRVLIADDHEPLRRGVLMALERGPFQVVAECGDGQSAVEETLRVRPEVCLLDVNMPGSGIEAAASIHRHLPSTRIVMLTISAESDDMFAAFRAGACGYLLKDTPPDRLPLALEAALVGQATLPRSIVLRLIDEFRGRQCRSRGARPARGVAAGLTPREWEVLDLLGFGYSTSEIAAELDIARVTVRSHVSTIMKKLHAPDREQAVQLLDEMYASDLARQAADG
jgi:DNA-binding NarL/FixJ family response regulator